MITKCIHPIGLRHQRGGGAGGMTPSLLKGGDIISNTPAPLLKSTNYCILYEYYISAIYSLFSIIISNIDLYCATQNKSIMLSPIQVIL